MYMRIDTVVVTSHDVSNAKLACIILLIINFSHRQNSQDHLESRTYGKEIGAKRIMELFMGIPGLSTYFSDKRQYARPKGH